VIDAAPQDAPSVEKPAPTTGSGSASVKPNDAA
jgi:hypothetical protein